MGHAIGATTVTSEIPKTRPIARTDLMATMYHFLAIDPRTLFHDSSGRPIPILYDWQPIQELG